MTSHVPLIPGFRSRFDCDEFPLDYDFPFGTIEVDYMKRKKHMKIELLTLKFKSKCILFYSYSPQYLCTNIHVFSECMIC